MKTSVVTSVAIFGAVLALGGCSETASSGASPSYATPAPAMTAMRTGSPVDEGACMSAVAQQTQNGDVAVLSSEFSQANTDVVVGVGPNRAQWRCLVSRGVVAEVMSLTNEGTL